MTDEQFWLRLWEQILMYGTPMHAHESCILPGTFFFLCPFCGAEYIVHPHSSIPEEAKSILDQRSCAIEGKPCSVQEAWRDAKWLPKE